MISIAFTGGGSGGHIYPGLAIASRVNKSLPCRIFWIGSGRGMDRAILKNAGVDFYGIPAGKLRRYFSLLNFIDIFKIFAGFFSAFFILLREKPVLLFSKGGFVSVPPCFAAKLLKIPVFIHESDYSPGLSTRLSSRFAERIFIPYKETGAFFKESIREKTSVSGNPIRLEFSEADPEKGRAFLGLGREERILLVLGGSQGSREINNLIRDCLPNITKHYTVIHQTGENQVSESNNALAGMKYKSYAYIREEYPHIVAAAELVLCRSGAGTIWECKSLSKPLILMPLSLSQSRGDQIENANFFQTAGAAVYFTGDSAALSELIASLANDPDRRKAMGEAKVSEADAGQFIAEAIIKKIGEV